MNEKNTRIYTQYYVISGEMGPAGFPGAKGEAIVGPPGPKGEEGKRGKSIQIKIFYLAMYLITNLPSR